MVTSSSAKTVIAGWFCTWQRQSFNAPTNTIHGVRVGMVLFVYVTCRKAPLYAMPCLECALTFHDNQLRLAWKALLAVSRTINISGCIVAHVQVNNSVRRFQPMYVSAPCSCKFPTRERRVRGKSTVQYCKPTASLIELLSSTTASRSLFYNLNSEPSLSLVPEPCISWCAIGI